jgi:hypothetical protein
MRKTDARKLGGIGPASPASATYAYMSMRTRPGPVPGFFFWRIFTHDTGMRPVTLPQSCAQEFPCLHRQAKMKAELPHVSGLIARHAAGDPEHACN